LFDSDDSEAGIATWLQSAAVEGVGDGWTRDELETHLREEHSTFSWLLEPMIERAGFGITTAEYGTAGAYANYMCSRRGR
jgi:hypothetical protein